ncbi:ATP-dependent Clp protease ATP-binding subunit [Candidatus Daviesbacteria bacterium]|nr:ATP-dependent Clp protease ATP-binding subunit [Candidatus Daviesbacteria bacterium]
MNKYLLLPIHLIKFWYPESLFTILRSWKNTILFLEEDLAVILMWKLLFVPLFHDASVVGRILSFLFRLTRILIGLLAFIVSSALILSLGLYWFLLPFLQVFNLGFFSLINQAFLFSGVGFFIIHVFLNPHKKVWQVQENSLWQASQISKKDLSLKKLFKSHLVQILIEHLELKVKDLDFLSFQDKDQMGLTAYNLAKITESDYINANHFFVACVQNSLNYESLLAKFELSLEDFIETLKYLERKRKVWRAKYVWDDDFVVHHLKGTNRGWLGVPTPVLNQMSQDLTTLVSQKETIDYVGNVNTIKQLISNLSTQGNPNVILVGPPGSGKSALISHLAKQIVTGDAPEALATKRIVRLDITSLLSGISTQGHLAERVKSIFEEIGFAKNVILVIDEIHNLGIGEVSTQMNLYSLMLPFLESSNFQFIATTDSTSYSRIIEKNGSFARLFSKVEILQPTEQEVMEVLEKKAIYYERNEKAQISTPALKLIIHLAKRYIHDRSLPDSALSVLEQAVAYAKGGLLNRDLVKEVVSHKVEVPLLDIKEADKQKLLNLEDKIHERLIDQNEAVHAVSDSLRRSATGIREENRPAGSFLFVGPTGVGKTELAKILADIYFEKQGAFLRIDMSEYQSSESVNRLIGVSGEGGILTEEIRRNPYSLLLLDEFEKADPKILTLFLQVLEDGRLTDGAGRLVDFTNTIIIATSNAASLTIADGLEQSLALTEINKKVNTELLQVFKPELVNRFDDIIIFKPLSKEDLSKIVNLKLKDLKTRLKGQGYLLDFDKELIEKLAEDGFDPVLGARPLRRLIQDSLESQVSKLILENKLVKGQPFSLGVELLR